MLLDTVRKLLGWHAAATEAPFAVPPTLLAPEIALAEDDDPVWPSARIGIAEALWGEGFLSPGGATETLRLAKPMGLSAASSLLLLGAGSGGSTRSIATSLGVWVSGFEANPRLAALANERSIRAGLGKRAQVETWDPDAPKFPLHYYHHGMALEPLHGARPEPTLAALSLALKPGGQLVLVELVADLQLDAADPTVAAWARLDHRPPLHQGNWQSAGFWDVWASTCGSSRTCPAVTCCNRWRVGAWRSRRWRTRARHCMNWR